MPRHPHRAVILALLAVLSSACQPSTAPTAVPRLPAGAAGQVLARALQASGGWERWLALRDLGYINTLTLFDPFGNVSSHSIGWYMAPLHRGLLARMESIGLPNEVLLGVNGADTWIVRDGTPITESSRIELTRFTMVSNLFWFSLPFALAEMPVTITDLGEVDGDKQTRWHRLKVVFEADNPGVPGEWFVLYFNTRTGLIERVHAKITAAFLRHELWVGKWLDYRDCNGLKKERQRQFFPADDQGEIIGNLVAEQLVERVQFNNGYKPESFEKPAQVTSGARVRADGPPVGAPESAKLLSNPAAIESDSSTMGQEPHGVHREVLGEVTHPSRGGRYVHDRSYPVASTRRKGDESMTPAEVKITLKAKGPNLAMPVPPLHQDLKLIVQLVNTDGACSDAEYSTAIKNAATQFRAQSD